ncbi:MAG TPA: hypothetical protein PLF42_03135, partial [Anaerolineales bacterium]|nr:hypothetical protein [Anaerolineales bacterium]
SHLNDLLADGVPMFGLIPEPEALFLTSAFTAAYSAGFTLESVAVRTEHDAVQVVWKSAQKMEAGIADVESTRKAMREFLLERGEPAGYLHLHTAGLIALTEANALKQKGAEFDEAMRKTNSLLETALKKDKGFVHHSTGEGVDTGMWDVVVSIRGAGRRYSTIEKGESLSDRVEMAVVTYLQKNPSAIFLEVEEEL